jgi:hypothetical protein
MKWLSLIAGLHLQSKNGHASDTARDLQISSKDFCAVKYCMLDWMSVSFSFLKIIFFKIWIFKKSFSTEGGL